MLREKYRSIFQYKQLPFGQLESSLSYSLTWMRDRPSNQRTRYTDDEVFRERQRHLVVSVVVALLCFLPEPGLLQAIHRREGGDHERDIPCHRRTPTAIEAGDTLRSVDGSDGGPKARIDPRHQPLLDHLLRDGHHTGPRRTQCRRHQRSAVTPRGPEDRELDGPDEKGERTCGEAAADEGAGPDVREGPAVPGLREGPEGVHRIEEDLGDPAAAASRDEALRNRQGRRGLLFGDFRLRSSRGGRSRGHFRNHRERILGEWRFRR